MTFKLHVAVEKNNIQLVQQLILQNENVNQARADNGKTQLSIAE
jgi:ankyrin repeat protein